MSTENFVVPENVVVFAAPKAKAFQENSTDFRHHHDNVTEKMSKKDMRKFSAILVNAESIEQVPQALQQDLYDLSVKVGQAKHDGERAYFEHKVTIVEKVLTNFGNAKPVKQDSTLVTQASARANQKIGSEQILKIQLN